MTQLVKNLLAMWETWDRSLGWEYPLEKGKAATPYSGLEKSTGCTVHGDTKSWTNGFPGGSDGKESAHNAGDLGLVPSLESSLEKGMVTHSSILAWRIPCT